MEIKFAQSARKHRVGNAYAHEVMQGEPIEGIRPNGEPELTWLGTDSKGRELEVVAVVTTDRRGTPIVLVVHVMPTVLRRR